MKFLLELSAADLKRAADIKDRITHLGHELASVLGISVSASPETDPGTPAPKRKFKMSAAGRAKIVAAQKARWAKVKAVKTKAAKVAKVTKKKLKPASIAKPTP